MPEHRLCRSILTVLSLLFLTPLMVRSEAPRDDAPPPNGLILLPGYTYRRLASDDSQMGLILKQGHRFLQFDLPDFSDTAGGGGGSVLDEINAHRSELLWLKEQTVHGLTVKIALTKHRQLYIVYPQANAGFWGEAKTEEDVVDALLMVLTYRLPPASPTPTTSKSSNELAIPFSHRRWYKTSYRFQAPVQREAARLCSIDRLSEMLALKVAA